jgi:hypothetical protein
MSYEPGRYLRRQDAKLPEGQKIEASAPVRVRVVSCHSGIGMAVVEVISDYTGRCMIGNGEDVRIPPERTKMDLVALRMFYRLEPVKKMKDRHDDLIVDDEKERKAVRDRIARDDAISRGRVKPKK